MATKTTRAQGGGSVPIPRESELSPRRTIRIKKKKPVADSLLKKIHHPVEAACSLDKNTKGKNPPFPGKRGISRITSIRKNSETLALKKNDL